MFRRDDEGNAFFWNQTSNETSWAGLLRMGWDKAMEREREREGERSNASWDRLPD